MRNCRISLTKKIVHKAELSTRLKGNESCRGQALFEIALTLMIFFGLCFGIMDFSWMLFSQMNMQDAVREAGRYAATGNHRPQTGGGTLTRIASITQVLDNAAVAANVKGCTVTLSNVSGGVKTTGPGGPGDTVTITAVCAIPTLTRAIGNLAGQKGKFHFTVSSTFVSEPFPPSQSI